MSSIYQVGMIFVLTLTPACSVQLYWIYWDRSPTPSEREMALFNSPLGSGNSFKRCDLVFPNKIKKLTT